MTHPNRRGDAERGAAAVEYALLVTAVAAAIVIVIGALGMLAKSMFEDSCDAIKSGQTSGQTCQ